MKLADARPANAPSVMTIVGRDGNEDVNIEIEREGPPEGAMYGNVGRACITRGATNIAVVQALKDCTQSLVRHIAEIGRPLSEDEMKRLVVTYVAPGGHGDPLEEELIFGWKYMADYDGPTD